MFDEKMLCKIMKECCDDGMANAVFLGHGLKKKLKKAGKILVSEKMSFSDEDRRNVFAWLEDNYCTLHEDVLNLVKHFSVMKSVKKHVKYHCYFEIFRRYLRITVPENGGDITELLEYVNKNTYDITLDDSASLVMLMTLAAYSEILDSFCNVLAKHNSAEAKNEYINKLFNLVHEISFVDERRIIKSNPAESVLAKDPCGLYDILTEETKNSYRKNLSRLAERNKMSEKEFAEKIVGTCLENEGDKRHIGFYLCDKPSGGRTYMFLLFFLTVLFTVLLGLLSYLFVLSAVPVYFCTRLLLEKFYLRFFTGEYHLPCVELSQIPEKRGVMTVITSLLSGRDDELFERLELMYHSNGSKNVYFGLLCDLPDSNERLTDGDIKILENANEKILTLRKKYGDVFFLFVRNRNYSKSEGKYIATERKRGAVGALSSFLCGKSDVFSHLSIKPDESICDNIRYVLTLDADTNLGFDCVKKLVGIMMHPQNEPEYDKEKAVVTKGFGIIQPAVVPTLDSANYSYFTKIMCGHGGVDNYSFGGSNKNMSLFGRSFFCGKGMFEKFSFCETLCGDNDFVHEMVLSHDAPEGARLKCAYADNVVFTDSFPKEELSYYKRKHRWIRGDMQNIPFLMASVRKKDGTKIKNSIGLSSKYLMFENVLSAMLPVFSLIMLFMSAFVSKTDGILMITVCLSAYILPFLNNVLSTAKRTLYSNFRRLFFSEGIYTGIWTSFMQTLFLLVSMPKSALVSVDAAVRSFTRCLVTKKRTLEWTTAAQNDAEKADGLLGYVKKNLFSALCGTVLFVISWSGIVKLLSLMWLFMPVFAYHSGKKSHTEKYVLSDSEKEKLIRYAEDIWDFFEDNISERTNHLPPDNIQLYAEEKMSLMTSPTNIGLYLLSAVSAFTLGFIDKKECEARLENTVKTVEKLEKYRGILYNWYNVATSRPMNPKYLSSVDMGNFLACIICVKQACLQYEIGDSMVKRLDAIIDEADVSLLYDGIKGQFYIGATVDGDGIVYDKNRYDMLMSEARILSFVSVALKKVPCTHLKNLSRRLVEGKGYMGLASWSGTTFEYFMPELFFKSKEGSLVYEALRFCYENMIKSGTLSKDGFVFGISESCYNELDSMANYKYYAFGSEKLAVKNSKTQRVYSPYSVFLFSELSPDFCLGTLSAFEKTGAYGKYGFYESTDFERYEKYENYAVVKCFMSHHLGMSLAAIVNLLSDGQIRNWFGTDLRMKSALMLTEEKIPYDAYVEKSAVRRFAKKDDNEQNRHSPETTLLECDAARLNLGKMSVYVKKDRVRMKYLDSFLLAKNVFPEGLKDMEIWLEINGERASVGKRAKLFRSGGRIVLRQSIILTNKDKYECFVTFTLQKSISDIFRINVKLKQLSGERDKNIFCLIRCCPVFETKDNMGKCRFFDENYQGLQLCDDKEAAFVFATACGVYFFMSGDGKKNTNISLDGETLEIQSCMKNLNGVLSSDFVMSVSADEKCAYTGLSRALEMTVDEAAAVLSDCFKKRKDFENRIFLDKNKPPQIAFAAKKDGTADFPVDSGEKNMKLLCSGSFSSLVAEKSLGFSFVNDAAEKTVTRFFGGNFDFPVSEKLCFDTDFCFDLCKHSTVADITPCSATYGGKLEDAYYRVKVYIPKDKPMKVISVETNCPLPLKLEILPSGRLSGKMFLGSGIAFFTDESEGNMGFLYGYMREKNSDGIIGAEYDIYSGVSAGFTAIDGEKRYVFCIGSGTPDTAFKCCRHLREEAEFGFEETKELVRQLEIDFSLMKKGAYEVLKKYFVFPEHNTDLRLLIVTSERLSAFDTLLSVYTKYPFVQNRLAGEIQNKKHGTVDALVLCIAYAEYVRLNTSKVNLYKECLSMLLDAVETAGKNTALKELLILSLECFCGVCEIIGDVRTGVLLEEKKKWLEKERKDGIFL